MTSICQTGPSFLQAAHHPPPAWRGQRWYDLTGTWEFGLDPGDSGEERALMTGKAAKSCIRVPYSPESGLSGPCLRDVFPVVRYRRTIGLAQAHSEQLLLRVSASNYETTAWVNGCQRGVRRGGDTPFTVKVDRRQHWPVEWVRRGRDDTGGPPISSGKQLPRHGSYHCFYTRTTGIWRPLWLEPVAPTYLASARVDFLADAGVLVVRTTLDGVLKNDCRLQVVARVGSAVSVPLSEVPLWSPSWPTLVDLQYRLVDADDRIIERVHAYTGLRWIRAAGTRIYLNDEKRWRRLVLDQGYRPGAGCTPSDCVKTSRLRKRWVSTAPHAIQRWSTLVTCTGRTVPGFAAGVSVGDVAGTGGCPDAGLTVLRGTSRFSRGGSTW